MTSIEFLFKELWETPKDKLEWHSIFEKAKQLHKQEIIDAADQNQFEDIDGGGIFDMITKGEQYYQETFKKD
jgi:hypothetical protein